MGIQSHIRMSRLATLGEGQPADACLSVGNGDDGSGHEVFAVLAQCLDEPGIDEIGSLDARSNDNCARARSTAERENPSQVIVESNNRSPFAARYCEDGFVACSRLVHLAQYENVEAFCSHESACRNRLIRVGQDLQPVTRSSWTSSFASAATYPRA